MDLLEELGMHAGAKPELFGFAKKLRVKMTEAEQVLWRYLQQQPYHFKFRRQHPFSRYILDFYCHQATLCIEIDGGYHDTMEQKTLDAERTEHIRSFSITELRFRNEEVLYEMEKVIHKYFKI